MKRVSAVTALVAQRIVDRTMQQLGRNVNVMDADGVIVGTGDPTRLGTVHEGALLAIRGERTILVDDHLADRLAGARTGVNLPLVVDGEVVGAIGVSGDLADVGQLADLLRLTAELMIEQASAFDDQEWRGARLDSLVQAMVAPVAPAELGALAAELDVDLTIERFAVRLVPRAPDDSGILREARRALHRGLTDVLTLRPDHDEVLALVPVTATVADLLRDLGPVRHRVTIAVGGRFGSGGLHASSVSARDVLACRGDEVADVVSFDDDRFAALVVGLDGGWRTDSLGTAWRRLKDADPVLSSTVLTFWSCGADLARSAEALHVHRNTLRNRLDRVEDLSGASLRDARGIAELVVGAILNDDLCMRTGQDPGQE